MPLPATLRALLLIVGGSCVVVAEAQASGFLVCPPAPQASAARRGWQLDREQVEATVNESTVRVMVTQVFRNLTAEALEARYVFPLPRGVEVSGVTLFEGGKPLEGRLLKGEAARTAYLETLRSQRDPALVRHVGQDLYETSVTPLPPNGSRTLTLKYEQVLRTDAGVMEWVHPVSGSFAGPEEGVDFALRLDLPLAGLLGPMYCPSFDMRLEAGYGGTIRALVTARLRRGDPDIALYWSASGSRVGATLLTYWPASEPAGYFLLLGEPARNTALRRTARPKAIHFVVDASGSMMGEKLAQVKAALRQAISALNPRDRFNVVAYNRHVISLWQSPQVFTPDSRRQAVAFVDRLQTAGGTDMEKALEAVLRAKPPEPGMPSVVVFLTDGRPTLGEVDTHKILEKVRAAQPEQLTRIFSLGVGVDVNSVLLDRLSLESRAVPEYVRPREDVEQKVAGLCEKIRFPILTDIAYDFSAMGASKVLPAEPADLFRGSRMVLSGRYNKGGRVELVVRGHDGSYVREYRKTLKAATRGQGVLQDFPARVWATRYIAALIDDIRLHGKVDPSAGSEIAHLSKRFGIVTEYTLYLTSDAPEAQTQAANRDATQSLLRAQTSQAVGNVAWAQSKNQTIRRAETGVARREQELYIPGANDRDIDTLDLGERIGAWPRVVANRTFYFRRDRGWVDAEIDDLNEIDEKVYRWSPRFFEIVGSASAAVNSRLAQSGDVLLRIADRTVHVVDGR